MEGSGKVDCVPIIAVVEQEDIIRTQPVATSLECVINLNNSATYSNTATLETKTISKPFVMKKISKLETKTISFDTLQSVKRYTETLAGHHSDTVTNNNVRVNEEVNINQLGSKDVKDWKVVESPSDKNSGINYCGNQADNLNKNVVYVGTREDEYFDPNGNFGSIDVIKNEPKHQGTEQGKRISVDSTISSNGSGNIIDENVIKMTEKHTEGKVDDVVDIDCERMLEDTVTKTIVNKNFNEKIQAEISEREAETISSADMDDNGNDTKEAGQDDGRELFDRHSVIKMETMIFEVTGDFEEPQFDSDKNKSEDKKRVWPRSEQKGFDKEDFEDGDNVNEKDDGATVEMVIAGKDSEKEPAGVGKGNVENDEITPETESIVQVSQSGLQSSYSLEIQGYDSSKYSKENVEELYTSDNETEKGEKTVATDKMEVLTEAADSVGKKGDVKTSLTIETSNDRTVKSDVEEKGGDSTSEECDRSASESSIEDILTGIDNINDTEAEEAVTQASKDSGISNGLFDDKEVSEGRIEVPKRNKKTVHFESESDLNTNYTSDVEKLKEKDEANSGLPGKENDEQKCVVEDSFAENALEKVCNKVAVEISSPTEKSIKYVTVKYTEVRHEVIISADDSQENGDGKSIMTGDDSLKNEEDNRELTELKGGQLDTELEKLTLNELVQLGEAKPTQEMSKGIDSIGETCKPETVKLVDASVGLQAKPVEVVIDEDSQTGTKQKTVQTGNNSKELKLSKNIERKDSHQSYNKKGFDIEAVCKEEYGRLWKSQSEQKENEVEAELQFDVDNLSNKEYDKQWKETSDDPMESVEYNAVENGFIKTDNHEVMVSASEERFNAEKVSGLKSTLMERKGTDSEGIIDQTQVNMKGYTNVAQQQRSQQKFNKPKAIENKNKLVVIAEVIHETDIDEGIEYEMESHKVEVAEVGRELIEHKMSPGVVRETSIDEEIMKAETYNEELADKIIDGERDMNGDEAKMDSGIKETDVVMTETEQGAGRKSTEITFGRDKQRYDVENDTSKDIADDVTTEEKFKYEKCTAVIEQHEDKHFELNIPVEIDVVKEESLRVIEEAVSREPSLEPEPVAAENKTTILLGEMVTMEKDKDAFENECNDHTEESSIATGGMSDTMIGRDESHDHMEEPGSATDGVSDIKVGRDESHDHTEESGSATDGMSDIKVERGASLEDEIKKAEAKNEELLLKIIKTTNVMKKMDETKCETCDVITLQTDSKCNHGDKENEYTKVEQTETEASDLSETVVRPGSDVRSDTEDRKQVDETRNELTLDTYGGTITKTYQEQRNVEISVEIVNITHETHVSIDRERNVGGEPVISNHVNNTRETEETETSSDGKEAVIAESKTRGIETEVVDVEMRKLNKNENINEQRDIDIRIESDKFDRNNAEIDREPNILDTLAQESKTKLLVVKESRKTHFKSIENLFAKDAWSSLDIDLDKVGQKDGGTYDDTGTEEYRSRARSEIVTGDKHEVERNRSTSMALETRNIDATSTKPTQKPSVKRRLNLSGSEEIYRNEWEKGRRVLGSSVLDSDCGLSLLQGLISSDMSMGVGVCRRCGEGFGQHQQIVNSNGEVWHPQCFVCAQCFQPFPEGVFYEFEGRKYCEHDFHVLFAPCCGKCGEFIVGRVIKALNNSWHPDCFRCQLCTGPLADSGFVKNAGRALCRECNAKEKARGLGKYVCHKCHSIIEEGHIKYKGEAFHPYHFNCNSCSIELNADAREVNGELYCLRCHDKMGIPICGACRRPIEERVVHALGKAWHVEHFVCAKCEKPFFGTRHYEKKGLAYCEVHYHQLFGNICFTCNSVISGDVFHAFNKAWHVNHFACSICDRKMSQKTKFFEFDMKPVCKFCYEKFPGELKKRLKKAYDEQNKK